MFQCKYEVNLDHPIWKKEQGFLISETIYLLCDKYSLMNLLDVYFVFWSQYQVYVHVCLCRSNSLLLPCDGCLQHPQNNVVASIFMIKISSFLYFLSFPHFSFTQIRSLCLFVYLCVMKDRKFIVFFLMKDRKSIRFFLFF